MKTTTPQAVSSCHDCLLWLIPHLVRFPKNHRFTLGERLENKLLNVLEHLIIASYSRQKQQALTQANQDLEICRHLWRLSFELKLISIKQYEQGSHLFLGLGQQIGGWLKFQAGH